MWSPKHVFALVLGLALCVGPAGAEEADLSGEWTLSMEGESPSGQGDVAMTFAADGHELVATMKGEKSDVECQGWFDGDEIRFYYIRPTAEGDFVAKYTGHVAGNLMGGEVDMGENGKTTWKATRGAATGIDPGIDLSGNWTLSMKGESPSGQEQVPVTFTADGNALVATMKGEKSDVECQGWIEGNKIRFYYIRPTAGGEFLAKYTGHVAGGLMGGEVDLGEHGKTTWNATRN